MQVISPAPAPRPATSCSRSNPAPRRLAADFFELTRGARAGRRFYDQITLFKSVGSALEDLAAAQLTVAGLSG